MHVTTKIFNTACKHTLCDGDTDVVTKTQTGMYWKMLTHCNAKIRKVGIPVL